MWTRYQEILLFLYAMITAILPIPNIEVIYLPIIASGNHQILWLATVATTGALIGDSMAYVFAYFKGRCILPSLIHHEELLYGEQMMARYGIWSILVGSFTTIPSFLLPYLAGLVKMNLGVFLVLRTFTIYLRCLVVGYGLFVLKILLNGMDRGLALLVIVFLTISWVIIPWVRGSKKVIHK